MGRVPCGEGGFRGHCSARTHARTHAAAAHPLSDAGYKLEARVVLTLLLRREEEVVDALGQQRAQQRLPRAWCVRVCARARACVRVGTCAAGRRGKGLAAAAVHNET